MAPFGGALTDSLQPPYRTLTHLLPDVALYPKVEGIAAHFTLFIWWLSFWLLVTFKCLGAYRVIRPDAFKPRLRSVDISPDRP